MGTVIDGVRSIRNRVDLLPGNTEVELYASEATVLRDGDDLIVLASSLEAVKRSATVADMDASMMRAHVYSTYSYTTPRFGRHGGRPALGLKELARSAPAPVHLQLSNRQPYDVVWRVDIRIPGGLKHCQPECYIALRLEERPDWGAMTATIRVMHDPVRQ